MNRIVSELLNSASLSSCKVKFHQIFTSVGQWSLGHICSCPSCGPWETVWPCRAREGGCSPTQHLAWTSDKLLRLPAVSPTLKTLSPCLGFSQCVSTDRSLCIKEEASALSTLHYHAANLSSRSEDFHHFSTETVCPLPLKPVFGVSLCFLGAFSHNSLFPLLMTTFPTAYLTNLI